MRQDFPTASFVGDETVGLRIGGGKYRLVVAMVYATGMPFVKRIGTPFRV